MRDLISTLKNDNNDNNNNDNSNKNVQAGNELSNILAKLLAREEKATTTIHGSLLQVLTSRLYSYLR